jgi:hypothetical protein
MTAVDLRGNIQYKKFKIGNKEYKFHCYMAFTHKHEAEEDAQKMRKWFDGYARVIKGPLNLYYVYIHER